MAGTSAETVLQRESELAALRGRVMPMLSEIRRYIQPSAPPFGAGAQLPGDRADIVDNTGEEASENLASALGGHLTNPGSRWFGIRLAGGRPPPDDEAAAWIEDATGRMMVMFASPGAGFQAVQTDVRRALVDFGTAAKFIADVPGRGPVFQGVALHELALGANDYGHVDTVARRWTMTVRNAVQRFRNRAGAKTLEKAGRIRQLGDRVEFVHLVEPRPDGWAGATAPTRKPFASITVNATEKIIVDHRGFDEMPYIVPRWAVRPGEVWGYAPGWKALPEVKMLQRSEMATIDAAELAVLPPLLAADEGILSPITMIGGEITVVRGELMRAGRDPVKAIDTGARPDIGEEWNENRRARIRRMYYEHLLQMSRDPRMTATQVLKIDEEALRTLGPFLGRVQAEDLGPTVERVFGIMLRAGLFAPVPPSLAGERLEVEYESPIARAQRLGEVSAIGSWLEVTGPWRAAHPESDDNIDGDGMVRHAGERLGVPRTLMRAERQVAKMRDGRQQEAERQAALDTVERLAPAAQSAVQAAAGMAGGPGGGAGGLDNNSRPAGPAGGA